MALNEAGLAAEFTTNRSNLANTPQTAGQKQATALGNFLTTGQGPGGSSVIGAPAGAAMAPGIISAYSTLLAAVINAKKIATAFDSAVLGVVLSGGVYGSHIAVTTPGPSSLASGLQRIWESQPATPSLAAKKEAKEYKNYMLQCITNGTGIPSVPIPPQTGPIT